MLNGRSVVLATAAQERWPVEGLCIEVGLQLGIDLDSESILYEVLHAVVVEASLAVFSDEAPVGEMLQTYSQA